MIDISLVYMTDMKNKQIYENNIVTNQNTGNNKNTNKPITVSFNSIGYMILSFLGLMMIFCGFGFAKLDDYDKNSSHSEFYGVFIFFLIIGILIIAGSLMIMINRKLKIVDNRLIYTSMFGIRHTFSLDDIEKVEIERYKKSSEDSIVITLDNYFLWITVDEYCSGYDELKKFFYYKGMLTVAGLKIRPYDDECESGIDYEDEWNRLLK